MRSLDSNFKRCTGGALRLIVMTAVLGFAGLSISGQTPSPTPAATPLVPAISELRGISINMTADEVTETLGKPKVADKAGFYYEFSKAESVQIGLDKNKKVRTIALIYSSDSADIPAFADIFGPDVPLVQRKNGGIYKMIRYPKAGFWVAYNRSAGKNALTIITMRRINPLTR